MTNECSVCHAEIPWDRTLCPACEHDQRAEQMQAGDAERIYRERQQRAACVE
jgi:predicted amidophosphoribosyltransferase